VTVNRVKNNFTGGELDPLLHARTDLPHWANGLRTGTNIELLAQGGFRRRRGTRFIEALLPQLTRVTAGVTITTPRGGTGANANDDDETVGMATTTNISTINPYVVVHYDLGSAKTIRVADVVGFRVSSGEADASDFFIEYSTDNAAWASLGAAIPVGNQTIGERTRRRTGPVTARYWRIARIGATDYGSATVNLREFNLFEDSASLSEHRRASHDFNAEQKFLLLFTDRNCRVYEKVNGVPARQADIRTSFTSAQLSKLNWTQSLDTMIVTHADVRPHKIQRQGADTEWDRSLAFFEFENVNLSDQNIADNTISPTDAEVGYRLTNGGVAQSFEGVAAAYADIVGEEWHYPRRTIVAGEYEARATLTAGTNPTTGTMDTWQDLGTTRAWENLDATNGDSTTTSTILIEIRDAVTKVVLESATIVLTATVST
jgi:hypothetical protein